MDKENLQKQTTKQQQNYTTRGRAGSLRKPSLGEPEAQGNRGQKLEQRRQRVLSLTPTNVGRKRKNEERCFSEAQDNRERLNLRV